MFGGFNGRFGREEGASKDEAVHLNALGAQEANGKHGVKATGEEGDAANGGGGFGHGGNGKGCFVHSKPLINDELFVVG